MIHVYPGMGASAEMYPKDWCVLPESVFHNWPPYQGETSIMDLAIRLIKEHGIREGDVLIGSSLGGIVACEIANRLPIALLILVGGAIRQEEVGTPLRLIKPFVNLAPIEFVRVSAEKLPSSKLAQMFSQANPEFIRAMCRAIFQWEGLKSAAPLFRIHGLRDRIIPCPLEIDQPIDGGHLIAMTRAAECVSHVESFLTRLKKA